MDIDMDLTGFDMSEIDALLRRADTQGGLTDPDAAPALRKAVKEHPSPEVRSRAGRLVARSSESFTLAHTRAVESLEMIASPDARAALSALARRELDTPLKREATAALARLRTINP